MKKIEKELKIAFLFLTLYAANRYLIKPIINIPFLEYISKCHFNDFCGGVVFCAYFNSVLILGNKKPFEKLHEIIILILFVGLIWEFVFPLFLSYSTSDVLDVIAYVLGGTVYYFIKR